MLLLTSQYGRTTGWTSTWIFFGEEWILLIMLRFDLPNQVGLWGPVDTIPMSENEFKASLKCCATRQPNDHSASPILHMVSGSKGPKKMLYESLWGLGDKKETTKVAQSVVRLFVSIELVLAKTVRLTASLAPKSSISATSLNQSSVMNCFLFESDNMSCDNPFIPLPFISKFEANSKINY